MYDFYEYSAYLLANEQAKSLPLDDESYEESNSCYPDNWDSQDCANDLPSD